VVSSDYLDLDVFLNLRIFYRACGYRVRLHHLPAPGDLVVVLRGDPGPALADHRGEVHVYDYVREHTIPWPSRFPQASCILVVSLTPPQSLEGVSWVRGYLPVIPALWQVPERPRQVRPLHIANWKPLREDPYQHQIVDLVRSGFLEVYGRKWDRLGVQTQGLSYLEANRKLAAARCCYGLMYAYQRGTTASGRMWQAPLNGCVVFSELGTALAGIPGIVEVECYEPANLEQLAHGPGEARLAADAAAYWQAANRSLAQALGLPLPPDLRDRDLVSSRARLHLQHLTVVRERVIARIRHALGPRRRLQALRHRHGRGRPLNPPPGPG
jgi:hypothetical protein